MLRQFRDDFALRLYDEILAELGEDVWYEPVVGRKHWVRGVFRNEYIEYIEGAVAVESRDPIFECKHSDVPQAAHGDKIRFSDPAFGDIWYRVSSVQPEGTEIVDLKLERCSA